ncbi:MAG TPA: hypothetical protein VFK41_06815 [Nocardioidaceae bacterium]|nr:hypothetical protein [Nocardioidaceae bacterium]
MMVVLFAVLGVLMALVLVTGARRAVRAVREPRVWPGTASENHWDASLRALAYASPGFAYLPPISDPRLFSDQELCQAWCASYETVRAARSARELACSAQERRAYLDELERRHPLAVGVWLVSAATGGGDPMPYLSQGFDDLRQEDR